MAFSCLFGLFYLFFSGHLVFVPPQLRLLTSSSSVDWPCRIILRPATLGQVWQGSLSLEGFFEVGVGEL